MCIFYKLSFFSGLLYNKKKSKFLVTQYRFISSLFLSVWYFVSQFVLFFIQIYNATTKTLILLISIKTSIMMAFKIEHFNKQALFYVIHSYTLINLTTWLNFILTCISFTYIWVCVYMLVGWNIIVGGNKWWYNSTAYISES